MIEFEPPRLTETSAAELQRQIEIGQATGALSVYEAGVDLGHRLPLELNGEQLGTAAQSLAEQVGEPGLVSGILDGYASKQERVGHALQDAVMGVLRKAMDKSIEKTKDEGGRA